MGCGAAKHPVSLEQKTIEQDNRQKNRQIELEMEKEKEENRKYVKILLLGAVESGKSTFAKQMRIIHGTGFSEKERMSYKELIHCNVIQGVTAILEGMMQMNIDFENNKRQADGELVLNSQSMICRGVLSLDEVPDVVEAIGRLWKDGGVRLGFSHRNQYHLNDSADYYLDSLERISNTGYIPTTQDVLRARLQTTGIVETNFSFKDSTFRMFDVGGQKSERRKWIHVFDDVTAVIFTAGLSHYDQVLFEDNQMNKMAESIELFCSIANHTAFVNSGIILFLNKKDIFAKKIKTSPLSNYFPYYKGSTEEEAREFIRSMYEGQNKTGHDAYTHFTNATDSSNVDVVFEASMALVLQQNLKLAGIF